MKSLVLPCVFCSMLVAEAQDKTAFITDSAVFTPATPAPGRNLLLKTAAALGYGGVVYFVFKKEDLPIQHESQEGKSRLATGMSATVSPLGEGATNWIACGTAMGVSYLTKDTRLQRTAFLWAGSLALNDLVTGSLKTRFQRFRPATPLPFEGFEGTKAAGGNRSFPSAHTSTAFATATVFATMYKDKKWVAPVAYGMAAMVGASRVYNNAHWASDVLAGAAVGFLSAKAVIGVDNKLLRKHIRIYPMLGRHTSVGMVYSFDK